MKPADPLKPPIAPMLAALSRDLPEGDYLYEPKWDGFRCIAFVAPERIELRSRNQRALARYFPEITHALEQLPTREMVLDGELVITGPTGFDFPALLNRLHPSATRVAREWLDRFQGAGIDGVVAKARTLTYQPGRRAMIKVKHEHTVETVVAGFRLQVDRPVVGSLLLAVYDGEVLRHVGVSSTFTDEKRRELLEELEPLIIPLGDHPWRNGFGIDRSPVGRLAGAAGRWDPKTMTLDWYPLRPERVCEVAYDQLDGQRFRHPAKFVRWRPDRAPRSCTIDQLFLPPPSLTEIESR